MKPERWEQIQSLYYAAREGDLGLRAALLDEACAGDESLRQEVRSLLASDEQAGNFLNTPAPKVVTDEIAEEQARSLVGRQLGHYRLLSQLGAGGMGEVYLAARADDQYRKQVAIKLVKRGMDTDNILRRFRHERQILAALDHPNIARLLDGGVSEDGLPYFVMEYIAGAHITDRRHTPQSKCPQHRSSLAPPTAKVAPHYEAARTRRRSARTTGSSTNRTAPSTANPAPAADNYLPPPTRTLPRSSPKNHTVKTV